MLDLGDEVEVRVDDIDPNGKVSLTPDRRGLRAGERRRRRRRRPSVPSSASRATVRAPTVPPVVSFEDAFDAEAREEFGDLGPAETAGVSHGRGTSGGGERRGGGDRGRAWSPPPAVTTRRPPVQTTTLPSGLRVVTERMPGARSVAAGVWVGVGARDEPAELAGVSHFLEHLLFKGTEDAVGPADRRGRSTGSAAT